MEGLCNIIPVEFYILQITIGQNLESMNIISHPSKLYIFPIHHVGLEHVCFLWTLFVHKGSLLRSVFLQYLKLSSVQRTPAFGALVQQDLIFLVSVCHTDTVYLLVFSELRLENFPVFFALMVFCCVLSGQCSPAQIPWCKWGHFSSTTHGP